MRTLILNSANILPNTNNSQLVFQFPAGNIQFKKGQRLALASLSMYYSTFNITTANNNTTYSYTWVNGVSYQVQMTNGFYDADALNNFLHFTMVQNKHYLVDATGNFVYFLTLSTNSSAYSIELNAFVMNTTIATANTWTLPAGATWVIPTVQAICPMLQVLDNGFKQVIGFNAGFYPQGPPTYAVATIAGVSPAFTQVPAYTTTQVFLSQFTPQITPLSSYILTCSLINNNYAVPNNLLFAFSPQGTFGSQFTITPGGQLAFIDIQEGQYAFIRLQFLDQNLLPVVIQDPNYVIMLIMTDPDETGKI